MGDIQALKSLKEIGNHLITQITTAVYIVGLENIIEEKLIKYCIFKGF